MSFISHMPLLFLQLISLFSFLSLPQFITLSDAASSQDYYVKSIPLQPQGSQVHMHAGNIMVDEEYNGALFFWLFHNRHIADRRRTILWLNGGPGCSSEDGALLEIGPFLMNQKGELKENPYAWNQFANVIFLDQPIGTGFGYVNTDSYIHELPQMANHVAIFLNKFYHLFPEYMDDDLYIAGESYAGQYIPYIADAILNNKTGDIQLASKLKGLLIGNGWIDPEPQYLSYSTFAYSNQIIEHSTEVDQEVNECKLELLKNKGINIDKCEAILNKILDATALSDNRKTCINVYDIRQRESYPGCGSQWPPELSEVTKYLRRDDVKNALNVNADKKTGWVECNSGVSANLEAKNSTPSIKLLPGILEKIPVLLFSGKDDLICNHLGTEEMMHNMTWNEGTGFQNPDGTWAPRESWEVNGENAGYYQTSRNLTYVLFLDSSHMVPYSQAARSLDMLNRFMNVNVTVIGEKGSDSLIAGSPNGVPTNVEQLGKSNAETKAKEKVSEATWKAYEKVGSIALVFVIFLAGFLGWFVYRSRKMVGANTFKEIIFGPSDSKTFGSRFRMAESEDVDNELEELVIGTPIFDSDKDRDSFEDRLDDEDYDNQVDEEIGLGSSSSTRP